MSAVTFARMVVVPQPCKARYYFRARPDRPKPMIVSRFIEPNGARSSCVQADEFPCPDSFASQFHRLRTPKRDAHTRLAVSDAHRVIQACGKPHRLGECVGVQVPESRGPLLRRHSAGLSELLCCCLFALVSIR